MLLHVVDLGENLKIRLDMKSANTFTRLEREHGVV